MKITEPDIRKALNKAISPTTDFKPPQTRAAVLIPVISQNNELDLLLTQRTEYVEHHKNQISFPGGVVDKSDDSVITAALRETQEEVGISPSEIEILGVLEDVTTPSQFLITPVVGLLKRIPPLKLNSTEVRVAFTIPLSYFCNEANVRIEYREFEGKKREVYFYEYGDKLIWGVTAYMIRLLLQRVFDNTT